MTRKEAEKEREKVIDETLEERRQSNGEEKTRMVLLLHSLHNRWTTRGG
jgi:hypothetical protein